MNNILKVLVLVSVSTVLFGCTLFGTPEVPDAGVVSDNTYYQPDNKPYISQETLDPNTGKVVSRIYALPPDTVPKPKKTRVVISSKFANQQSGIDLGAGADGVSTIISNESQVTQESFISYQKEFFESQKVLAQQTAAVVTYLAQAFAASQGFIIPAAVLPNIPTRTDDSATTR